MKKGKTEINQIDFKAFTTEKVKQKIIKILFYCELNEKLVSISTTVRSPYRIPDQLKVIKKYFEGKNGTSIMPREFMYRIIQSKAYSPSLKKLSQKDQIKYENNEILDFNLQNRFLKSKILMMNLDEVGQILIHQENLDL